MMRSRWNFFGLSLLLFIIMMPVDSYAEDKVGPFGFGVGTSTILEVQQNLNSFACDFDNQSVINNGFLFKCDARVFDMEGLTDFVYFIFENKVDQELRGAKLELANLTFNKEMYDSIVASLSSKYKLVSKHKAFVGDSYARFKKDNVNILVESPHMSFTMSVTYSTENFDKVHQEYKKRQSEENASKQKSQL